MGMPRLYPEGIAPTVSIRRANNGFILEHTFFVDVSEPDPDENWRERSSRELKTDTWVYPTLDELFSKLKELLSPQ